MSNDAPIVRRARRQDQEAVGALWAAFLREQATLDDRAAASEDARTRWDNDFAFWLRDERRGLWVAEEEGAVCAFVRAQYWTPPPVYVECLEVHVDELYVAPRCRGSGVAAALVAAVRTWAEAGGAQRLRLSVLAANEEGQAFWEAQRARPFYEVHTIDLDPGDAGADAERSSRLGFH